MRITELSALSGLTARNIRKYISLGLVSSPVGRTSNAAYTDVHLAELLAVRKLLLEGTSLKNAKEVMNRTRGRSDSAELSGDALTLHTFRVAQGVFLTLDSDIDGIPGSAHTSLISEIARTCDKFKRRAHPSSPGRASSPSALAQQSSRIESEKMLRRQSDARVAQHHARAVGTK